MQFFSYEHLMNYLNIKNLTCCSNLLNRYKYYDFLNQIITWDKKLITYDNQHAHNQ